MGRATPGAVDLDGHRRAVPARRPAPLAARRRRRVRGRTARHRHPDRVRLGARRAARRRSLVHRAGAAPRTARRRTPIPSPAAFVLAPRREMAWSNSIAYGAAPDGAVVRMNPADVDGDAVTLTTEHGARHGRRRRRRDGARRGRVDDARPHRREPGRRSRAATVDVDGLTAMPRVSGLDVRVTPAAQPPDD